MRTQDERKPRGTFPSAERVEATIRSRRRFRLAVQGVVLACVLGALTLAPAAVRGPSMEPTIASGGIVVFARLGFALRGPRRGDVIAFREDLEGPTLLVKRVVGVPGDAVRIDRGRVFVGGRPLPEPYVRVNDRRSTRETRVPPESLYVLGDDRPRSIDSRSFGCIRRRSVVGGVFFTLWPPNRFGTIGRG